MTDDGIRGWDVPEIREAVFRRSKQRADLVRADAMERARRIANLLKVREGFRGQYWEMYVMADEIAGPFDLSIVCIEDAQDTLIEHAREGGICL